jgi:hypothetical protein
MKTSLYRFCCAGLIVLFLTGATSNEPRDRLPDVGARVRVTSPKLSAGWHVAMLNQLRTTPVCLVVLVFDSAGKNEITAQLNLADIVSIQASNLYPAGNANYDGSKVSYPGEKWLDVPLAELRATSKCQTKTP